MEDRGWLAVGRALDANHTGLLSPISVPLYISTPASGISDPSRPRFFPPPSLCASGGRERNKGHSEDGRTNYKSHGGGGGSFDFLSSLEETEKKGSKVFPFLVVCVALP